MNPKRVSILGAGSFGTALAQTVANNIDEVYLLGRDPDIIDGINKHHENPRYFPGLTLAGNIRAAELGRTGIIAGSEFVIFAVPSGVTREIAREYGEALDGKTVLSTAKGIEAETLNTMSEIIVEESRAGYVASLSGPTFADELIRGYLSVATLGADDDSRRDILAGLLRRDSFILDYSPDIRGVELAGVLKNTYAIALGVFDSAYSSNNGHYAFLNLCYKELCRILAAASGDHDIAAKYCAFGDYNLTANVDKSRNRTLGLMIGKNFLKSARVNSGIVFEGLKAIRCLRDLSHRYHLESPIIEFVNQVLEDNSRVISLLDGLLKKIR